MNRFVSLVRAHVPWLEPWYEWGRIYTVRFDQSEPDFSDESEGEGWEMALQWFGLHLSLQFGIQPRKISPEEVASRKRRIAWTKATEIQNGEVMCHPEAGSVVLKQRGER